MIFTNTIRGLTIALVVAFLMAFSGAAKSEPVHTQIDWNLACESDETAAGQEKFYRSMKQHYNIVLRFSGIDVRGNLIQVLTDEDTGNWVFVMIEPHPTEKDRRSTCVVLSGNSWSKASTEQEPTY